METEFIILIAGFTIMVCVSAFFIYRAVTFIFFRKVIAYIMEPISTNKYHVLKKVKKKIGTETIKYDDGLYPLDTKFAITDVNNSELIFFKHGSAKPLTFFESEKGNAKLLKTIVKTKIWQQIFGGSDVSSTFLILVVLTVISFIMVAYLIYANSQMQTQVGIMQHQLELYYNATKGGTIIIGK